MSDKRVGGIFASSFIAGVLLAAAIVSPRAWEPVPGPSFDPDDAVRPAAGGPVQLGDGIEAVHAALSLRARTAVATTQPDPAGRAAAPSPTSPFPESSRDAVTAILNRVPDAAPQVSAADSPPPSSVAASADPPAPDPAAMAVASPPPAAAPVPAVGPDPVREEATPLTAIVASAAPVPTSSAQAPLAVDAARTGPEPQAATANPPPDPGRTLPRSESRVVVGDAAAQGSDGIGIASDGNATDAAGPPPERVAIAGGDGPAATRAMAAVLPSPPAQAMASATTPATASTAAVVKAPVASGAAPSPSGGSAHDAAAVPPESLKALVSRVQAAQPVAGGGPQGAAPQSGPPLPRIAMAPSARPLPAAVAAPPAAVATTPIPPSPPTAAPRPTSAPPAAAHPPGLMPPVPLPHGQLQRRAIEQGPSAWVATLPAASQPAANEPAGSQPRAVPAGAPAPAAPNQAAATVVPLPTAANGSLGAAPLPGEPWTDPDGVNWSDAVAAVPPIEPDRRRSWLVDRRPDPRAAPATRGGRILDRFRGGERRVASLPGDPATKPLLADTAPVVPGAWPRPVRLEQQLDHLARSALAHDDRGDGEPIAAWANQARGSLRDVTQTSGPRDGAADASLIALGETVIAGMSLADTTDDAGLASLTRRSALAVARRVAVWRAGTALFATLKPPAAPLAESDAAAAMTRQFHGRAVEEIGRLLEGIERFEVACTPADARAVKGSLQSICGFYPTAGRLLGRAVEDHYLAPNVRIAVHRKLLESLLPAATVDTAPFTDVVAGHEVRGTRTVERKTTLRLVPDDDEICLSLEVQGDIASRSKTDAGAVSVTARSASAFVVHKPISIGSRGLLFGDATGAASNRSRLDTIQTSFDGVPVMGQLVRNIARNQHAETMPTVNREVIDKIISRACREVDTQAEPEFARMAERVRERAWMPLVRLGLDPKAVALQTTATTATMRLRLAADTQLAAHTPRPRAPADALLSVQLHESTANNALERLGLAGRRYTLEELIRTVSGQLGVEPRVPDDLPEGVTVAFAASQPLRIECHDGLVHVRVALDAIESGRRDWYDLIAHVAYRPVCRGPQVFLEREGPIQLAGPGTEGRMELALRTIFGKIFPKERPVAVLPEKIVANPRLTDVQATQAVSSDGWLAVTLEERAAPVVAQPTAAPAPAARPADARRKSLFR